MLGRRRELLSCIMGSYNPGKTPTFPEDYASGPVDASKISAYKRAATLKQPECFWASRFLRFSTALVCRYSSVSRKDTMK